MKCNLALLIRYILPLFVAITVNSVIAAAKEAVGCTDITRVYSTDSANDDLFVVAQLSYGDEIVSSELFIYLHDGQFYLPLQLLAELLLLPIKVDIENLTAQGWFQDPQNTIAINDGLMKFPSNSDVCSQSKTTIFFDDWDLYFEQSVIEQMLGLTFHFEVAQQHLVIEELEAIPLSQIKQRNEKLTLYNNKSSLQNLQYHHFPNQYSMLGDLALYADVGVFSLDQQEQRDTYSDGSVQVRFDALGSSVYSNYSWSPSDQEMTAYIEREQSDFWIKQYRLGNINSHSLPLISGSEAGSGATIYAGDGFTNDIRNITVDGESLPGWDVELYRNSSLVALQRVGSDGLYLFTEVPFYIGINQYQLRFYGPNGEQNIESFSRILDSSVMEKGSFGVKSGYVERETDALTEYYLYSSWAAMEMLTLGLGITNQESSENQWQMFPSISANIITDSTLWQLTYVQSELGYAMNTAVQGHHFDLDWQADWLSYQNYESWNNINGQGKYESNISVNGGIDTIGLNYSVAGQWQEYVSGAQNWSATTNMSSRIYEVLVNNSVQVTGNDLSERWTDRFSLSGRYLNWYLRSYAEFLLNQEPGLTRIGLNGNYSFADVWNYQAELLYFDSSETSKYSIKNSMSYAFDYGSLRFSMDMTEVGDWLAQLRWSSSLLWSIDDNELYIDRMSYVNSGAVLLEAFEDNNVNGHFDEDEVAIEGLRFFGHKNSKQKTNENGELLLTHLQSGRDQRLVLDNDSLPDPFFLPEYPAISVSTHPGNIQKIPFPVVFTSELEGSVSLKDKERSMVSSGLHVELKDLFSGVSYETWVEYDGVFVFDRLKPGTYHLLINGKSAENIVELVPGDYVELGEYVILIAETAEKQS